MRAMENYIKRLDEFWRNSGETNHEYYLLSQQEQIIALLQEALSDPSMFVGFIDLYSHPVILCLSESRKSNTEGGENDDMFFRLLHTLHLFAHGTYKEYLVSQDHPEGSTPTPMNLSEENMALSLSPAPKYLVLDDTQIQKLKALSLVTYIKRQLQNKSESNVLSYDRIQSELHLENVSLRSFEDFLIDCIYSKLLPKGTRLDQQHKRILIFPSSSSSSNLSHVSTMTNASRDISTLHGDATSPIVQSFPFSRDVDLFSRTTEMNDLERMIDQLERIKQRSESLIQSLDSFQNTTERNLHQDEQKWSEIEQRVEQVRSTVYWSHQNSLSKSATTMGDVTGGRTSMSSLGYGHHPNDEKRQTKRSRGGGIVGLGSTKTGRSGAGFESP